MGKMGPQHGAVQRWAYVGKITNTLAR